VYVCVNKLARAIARLPLKTYGLSLADGERTEERTIPLAKLLRKPWPGARQYNLIECAVSTLAIYGNATFVKFRGGNGQTPVELWELPWPQVDVIAGRDYPIESYRWTGTSGKQKVFMAEDVVHFKYYNPNPDEPYGVSPLEALATTLSLEDSAQRYGISSFGNAARPASFIQSSRNLTRQQRKELREEIEQSYGGPENAFKVALLDNGLDWKPLAFSASEAQLVDNRKLSREEVCAVYDIPPPMVGILDHATYSNIDQQHWMLYMDTLAPICRLIEDTMMAQLIDPEPAWDGAMVEFDMNAVLKGNIEQRSQAYQRFLQSGVYTPNQLRKFENEPPIEDPAADALYVPVNLEAVSPEMRKLQEQEAQQQQERADQQAQLAHEQHLELAAAGGTPKPSPAPPPPPKLDRRVTLLEERVAALDGER
jgi:HK97 family phage portal protein